MYPHGGPDRKAFLALIKWELRNALKIRLGDILAVFKRYRLFGDYYVHRAVENGVSSRGCTAVFVCLTAYGKSAVGKQGDVRRTCVKPRLSGLKHGNRLGPFDAVLGKEHLGNEAVILVPIRFNYHSHSAALHGADNGHTVTACVLYAVAGNDRLAESLGVEIKDVNHNILALKARHVGEIRICGAYAIVCVVNGHSAVGQKDHMRLPKAAEAVILALQFAEDDGGAKGLAAVLT